MKALSTLTCVLFLTLGTSLSDCFAQGSSFTYQGELKNNGSPVNGIYDLRFTIYDTVTNGNIIGNSITNSATAVSNGLFTTTIDFGTNLFNGQSLWLDIAVSTNGANAFTLLTPRQQVTPTPYAFFAAGASAAGLSGTISGSNIATGSITSNLLATASVGTNQLMTNIGVWTRAGNNICYNAGSVGIGTNNPGSVLDVAGATSLSASVIAGVVQGTQTSGSTWGSGIYGRSLVAGGNGVIGEADIAGINGSFPVGVVGISAATNGVGLQALANASSGPTVALMASVNSPNGYAGQFTGAVQMSSGSNSVPLTVSSSSTSGAWLDLIDTSTNGSAWNLISSGPSNGEGPGKLLIHQGTGTNTIMTLQANGNVGIGTGAPAAPLHVTTSSRPSAVIDGSSPAGTWLALRNQGGGTNWHIISTGSINGEGPGKLLFDYGDTLSTVVGSAMILSTSGVTVYGTFNNNSDRNSKQDIQSVSPDSILDEVLHLPVSQWSYKTDPATRHIGPMAQDFYSVFNIGSDDKHIAPIDEGGVALAAIQGLNHKMQEQAEQLKARDATIQDLQKQNEMLQKRLEALEQAVSSVNSRIDEIR